MGRSILELPKTLKACESNQTLICFTLSAVVYITYQENVSEINYTGHLKRLPAKNKKKKRQSMRIQEKSTAMPILAL